jgi:hypothetical protein
VFEEGELAVQDPRDHVFFARGAAEDAHTYEFDAFVHEFREALRPHGGYVGLL